MQVKEGLKGKISFGTTQRVERPQKGPLVGWQPFGVRLPNFILILILILILN